MGDLGHLHRRTDAVVEDAQQPDNQANNVGGVKGNLGVVTGRCGHSGGAIAKAIHQAEHARIAFLLWKFMGLQRLKISDRFPVSTPTRIIGHSRPGQIDRVESNQGALQQAGVRQTLLNSRQNGNHANHQAQDEIDGDKELVDAAASTLKGGINHKNAK